MNEMSKNYVWDDRAPSFGSVGDIALHIADRVCGVSVDETTGGRWVAMMKVLREFDTYCDDIWDGHGDPVAEKLGEYTELWSLYPELSPEAVPSEQRESALRTVRRILGIGHIASNTENIDAFIELRLEEADCTAELLADFATPDVREAPQFDRFLYIMKSLSRTACLLDTILDLPRDRAEGKVLIEPHFREMGKLTARTIESSVGALPALANPTVAGAFCRMSVVRLQNRVRRGINAYSSLHNLKRARRTQKGV